MDSSCFAPTYAKARDIFLAAAAARGAAVSRHVLPSARGSEGEALSIDAAHVGDGDAPALLILSSGTHGIEGFCGSGCQLALLRDDAFMGAAASLGVALLFVHAVNPYGFSHLRRVNEDNVDLNRNFRDFSVALPANPAYARVHRTLLPDEWPPTVENQQVVGALIAEHGVAAYQAAVSGGQYEFADGMFYGGRRPAWSNERVRALLREQAARRARFGWIDFHSGLGPPSRGEKIYAGRDEAGEIARARAWWGPQVTSFHDGSSTSAALTGTMYCAAYEECPGVEYTGIALEYGTVPLPEVFAALRGDHWLRKHPDAPQAVRHAIRANMRAAFLVDTPEWKATVVDQARGAALAAVTQLGRGG